MNSFGSSHFVVMGVYIRVCASELQYASFEKKKGIAVCLAKEEREVHVIDSSLTHRLIAHQLRSAAARGRHVRGQENSINPPVNFTRHARL